MSNVWFSSDLHLGHKNIIEYSARPWSSVEEMNDGLIERWNSRIKPGDTVYLLGDFTLTKRTELIDEWLSRLNGEIRLVRGNHDDWVSRFDRLKHGGKIKWIRDYAERTFEVDGKKWKLILSHFPMLFWDHSHHGSIMLHGHCHGNAQHHNVGVRRYDVGVDCNDWYPVQLEEIVDKMKQVGLNPHHARHEQGGE